MLSYLKKRWKYVVAKLTGRFNETADPKVQLEQAIAEGRDQHRRLREQAANVIANQKQTELQLNRALEELEKTNANARQAVLMADEAAKNGDGEKAAQYTTAAESFATKMIGLESEVEGLKGLHYQAAQAADSAKAAVEQNSVMLQKRLSEKQELLGKLDQAKMQEQVNDAMASISETVGDEVPSFNEVRDKIDARYAKAKGMAELNDSSVESNMMEIEKASRNVEAQARLSQIKEQLGIEVKGASVADIEAEVAAATDGESAQG